MLKLTPDVRVLEKWRLPRKPGESSPSVRSRSAQTHPLHSSDSTPSGCWGNTAFCLLCSGTVVPPAGRRCEHWKVWAGSGASRWWPWGGVAYSHDSMFAELQPLQRDGQRCPLPPVLRLSQATCLSDPKFPYLHSVNNNFLCITWLFWALDSWKRVTIWPVFSKWKVIIFMKVL